MAIDDSWILLWLSIGHRLADTNRWKITNIHRLLSIDRLLFRFRFLSIGYALTNHSIRATTITILDECGYEARHIIALSGHRSESSIRSYASQTSLSTKRKMSKTLSESLNNKKTVTTIAATSSVGHSEIPVAENTPEPLLTASREEYILNELSKSNTQLTVYNFYNCTFNF